MAGRILVVDDSRAIRQLLVFVLGKAGYETVEAADGREALARLGEGPAALVICDLIMPNLDGLSLLRALRGLPAHAATPVLMLTTESGAAAMSEARSLGARGWIVKPFTPEQVLAAVARLLPAGA